MEFSSMATAKEKQYKEELDALTQLRLSEIDSVELQKRYLKIEGLQKHPLFTLPPQSVSDSHRFGWLRGIAIMTETLANGAWYSWLFACSSGATNIDKIPENIVSKDGHQSTLCYRMLDNCMNIMSRRGYRITDFIEWIGYGLGIAWFKKPLIDDDIWEELYKNFNLDIFFMAPADYLSTFVAVHGQKEHLDYYPTPIHVTDLINKLINQEDDCDRTRSQIEPCVGAAAMLLPSNQLNMVGIDLSLTMVKVTAIQAFLYKPWLLYVPRPIINVHVDADTKTINRYFEFNTDTRIYNGDSLQGELKAPVHIFEEDSPLIDIYLNPSDLSKRESLKYQAYSAIEWTSVPEDIKRKIVIATAREIPFQIGTTNPPFNMHLGKVAREKDKEIAKKNEQFLDEHAKRVLVETQELLAKYDTGPHEEDDNAAYIGSLIATESHAPINMTTKDYVSNQSQSPAPTLENGVIRAIESTKHDSKKDEEPFYQLTLF